MQVAVADVTEPANLEVGIVRSNQSVDVVEEGGHIGNAHGDLVLVRREGGDAFGNTFSKGPHRLRLRI